MNLFGRIKRLINEKMQIAIFGMTKDNALGVPEIIKEVAQVGHGICEMLNGKGNIFIYLGRATRTHRANGCDDTFARFPQRGLRDGVIGEVDIVNQFEFVDDAPRLFLKLKHGL